MIAFMHSYLFPFSQEWNVHFSNEEGVIFTCFHDFCTGCSRFKVPSLISISVGLNKKKSYINVAYLGLY